MTPRDRCCVNRMLLLGAGVDASSKGFFDLQDRSLRAAGDPCFADRGLDPLDWNGASIALQLAFFDHHLARSAAATPLPEFRLPI